jgi:hypothetical protein
MSSPKAEPLLRLGITVDGERDPDPADDQLCFAAAVVEDVGGNVGESAQQLGVDGAHAPVWPFSPGTRMRRPDAFTRS